MATSRRKWLKTSAALTAGCLAPGMPGQVTAQGVPKGDGAAGAPGTTPAPATEGGQRYGAANLGLGITRQFGGFLSGIRFADLPPAAIHEARRAVLDWIGCALAGSQHPTPRILLRTLAANGFNSSAEILEGSLGFVRIYSATQNLGAITVGLGERWQITGNGYKPYACGVVLHPLIDAAIGASRQGGIPAEQVASIEMLVHPDVIRITGIDTPGSGLMSKFSANHAVAVAYIDRAGGVQQFSNERAQDAQVQALRKRVQVRASQDLRLDQAIARVTSLTGTVTEMRIEHATGTVANPMTDRDLEAKFLGNADGIIPAAQAREVADLVWHLEAGPDVGAILQRCR